MVYNMTPDLQQRDKVIEIISFNINSRNLDLESLHMFFNSDQYKIIKDGKFWDDILEKIILNLGLRFEMSLRNLEDWRVLSGNKNKNERLADLENWERICKMEMDLR